MAWFFNNWTERTSVDVIQKGLIGEPEAKEYTVRGDYDIDVSKTRIAGSRLTGAFSRTWDSANVAIRRKGTNFIG